MQYSEFLGQVQQRAQLDSEEAAVRVTRSTLETLSERIDPGEADDLAAQLPAEIGRYLTEVDTTESYGWDEFVDRLADRLDLTGDDRADAVFQAQVVIDVVDDAVSGTELREVRGQLPAALDQLFDVADQEGIPG